MDKKHKEGRVKEKQQSNGTKTMGMEIWLKSCEIKDRVIAGQEVGSEWT